MARSGHCRGTMSCILTYRSTALGAYPTFKWQAGGEEHHCSLPGARLNGTDCFQPVAKHLALEVIIYLQSMILFAFSAELACQYVGRIFSFGCSWYTWKFDSSFFCQSNKNIEAFMFVTLTSFGVCFSSRLTFSIVQHEAHCTL